MEETKITALLNKFVDISEFVKLTSKCKGDVVAKSGRFVINAKSLMGLYSLDLTQPLEIVFYGNIPDEIKEGIKKFMVN